MANLGGYAGKILRVDLSAQRVWTEDLDEATARQWLGGVGIGAKILYEEVPPGVAWDDPENRIIIGGGPLAGTRVMGSGTISVVTKGCMTNGATSTQANGYMGAYMKFAGFDAIAIQGKAPRWLYLYLHDGQAELKEASHLLGKDTWDTDEAIKAELGYRERDASVFCVGPAGERLSKLAAICGDKGHVAGHNGTGAVMGAKRLKAIVAARGKGAVAVKDGARLRQLSNERFALTKEDPGLRRLYLWGTLDFYEDIEGTGGLPIKNYQTNIWPGGRDKIAKFRGQAIRESFDAKRFPCWACQMNHIHQFTIPEGPWKGAVTEEPEYEGLAAWGALTGNWEVADTVFLSNEVDRLGFETNGAGWAVALAMELYEKGILSREDLGGLDLTWGNSLATREFLYLMARRQGIGAIFADGAKAAAEALGGEALASAIFTAKGGVPRGHDHRSMWAEMFETATSSTGTLEHGRNMPPDQAGLEGPGDPFNPDDVVRLLVRTKGGKPFEDSMGVCTFITRIDVRLLVDMLSAATGWDYTLEEAMQAGERVATLMRAFNLRHGITAEADLAGPSARYGGAPVDGPVAGVTIKPHWENMVHSYYEQSGWDRETGKPLPETLQRLGLDYVVKDIWEAEPAR